MKTLLSTFALLGALTGAAFADDHADSPAEEAENACAADDCADLEGDAKTECEAKKAEAEKQEAEKKEASDDSSTETAEPPKEEKKGKKMDKSNDNRMESYDSDE